jgi:hypothetical protein
MQAIWRSHIAKLTGIASQSGSYQKISYIIRLAQILFYYYYYFYLEG